MTKKNIYVIGYPKTGTTWTCRLLGDVLNSEVGSIDYKNNSKCIASEGQRRIGNYFIGHGHQLPVKGNKITQKTIGIDVIKNNYIILMTRDYKDTIVSVKHHWGMGTIKEAIEKVYYGKWPITHGGGIINFYKKWDDFNQIYVNYKNLLSHTELQLEFILSLLKIDTSKLNIAKSVQDQSFENRIKYTKECGDQLNYGKEFQQRFLRKGIVGDWKNQFTDDDLKYYNSLFGE